MPDLQPTAAIDYDQPDWSNAALEAHCPLCDYNLRGLSDPRCPECGYQFEWRNLLDPARNEHAYLFELRSSKRFAAFWKTAWNGLRPRKFWTVLRPDQRSSPGALFVYASIVTIAMIIAVASEMGVGFVSGYESGYMGQLDIRYVSPFVLICAGLLTWPILTFLSLMVFQISMRRAKVKVIHVVRCVVYCWDIALWASIIIVGMNLARIAIDMFPFLSSTRITYTYYSNPNRYEPYSLWIWLVAIGIFSYRLVIAYSRYLRFRHVIWTVVLIQFVVVLAEMILLGMILEPIMRDLF